MTSKDFTSERFYLDLNNHKMTIIRDEGFYRHIRFSKPNSNEMYFELTTWPGYLCFSGDMGCYVFQRINDMFNFFHTTRVNIPYWSEKLEAYDRMCGFEKFDAEKLVEQILEQFEEWEFEDMSVQTDARLDLNDLIADIKDCEYLEEAANLLDDYKSIEDHEFDFSDGYNAESYTYHFIWCLHAICWGVNKYFETKGTANEPSLF
jgi:hypothetical protein